MIDPRSSRKWAVGLAFGLMIELFLALVFLLALLFGNVVFQSVTGALLVLYTFACIGTYRDFRKECREWDKEWGTH